MLSSRTTVAERPSQSRKLEGPLSMLIRLVSDIHLEFGNPWEEAVPEMPEDPETVLVVAGDVASGVDACDFLQQVSSRFQHVLYVMGNHEFYRGNDLHLLAADIKEELSDFPTVDLLDNDTVVVGGTRFIGSTLWTDMEDEDPTAMILIEQGMNDYRQIRKNGRRITAEDTIAVHKLAVAFIDSELAIEHDGPTVVVTHHLPSFKSVHSMFRQMPAAAINGGFCSNLEWLLEKHDIDYWFHGHTHQTVSYEIAGTKVRMNPLGYGSVHNLENPLFETEWRIEL
jgi:predicted phosphodiesterase